MKRYYGIIDEDGFLTETGTNRKELKSRIKEIGEEAFIVNLAEGVYQYALESRNEEPLHIDELSEEYDSRIDEAVYYLNLQYITLGDLRKMYADLPDDTEIILWDTDTRAVKSCVGVCMNGSAIQLEAETWGRNCLKY